MSDRSEQIYTSCKEDVEAKIAVLLEMLKKSDPSMPRHMAETAIAAENTAIAVQKLYRFNLEVVSYGLA